MPAYDSGVFDPPAPVATITLRHPKTGKSSDPLAALLDTGADVTLLPRSAVAAIGVVALPEDNYELVGFDGRSSSAPSVELDLMLFDKAVRGRYLLYDQDYGILGRDLLNLASLVMDGPRLAWHGRWGSHPGPEGDT